MLAEAYGYSRMKNRVNEHSRPDSIRVFDVLLFMTVILAGETMAQESKWVDSALARMSLEEKVGQLFIADFVGVYSHRESQNFIRIIRQIEAYHIGGIILAGGAVLDIAISTNELQRRSKLPLLVAADTESGLGFWHPWRYVRGRSPDLPKFIPGGGTVFPSNMALGATGSEDYAYQVGKITGAEARAVGINWALAPVVDVNNNPKNPIVNTRSFGEDPEVVGRLGAAFVRGCQESGVIATLKHFPGHGDTEQDSHMGLPILDFDRARLDRVELVPYREGIDAGAMAIMTAHIALPRLDPSRRPATLSEPILSGLLRQEMKFDGIIVTDGLTMQGITDRYGTSEAALLSLQAGADALLVPPDIGSAYPYILEAVKQGKLTEERLDSSVRRILEAKQWLGLNVNRYVDPTNITATVGAPRSEALAKQMARDAITLLKNEQNTLPIPRRKNLKLGIVILSDVPNREYGRDFISMLKERYSAVTTSYVNSSTSREGVDEALRTVRRSDVSILPVYVSLGAWKGPLRLPPPAKNFLRGLPATKKSAIAVSFGDPYVISEMTNVSALLCTYTGIRVMEEAVVEALLGETDIKGKLPVTIPPKYKRGDGVELQKSDK
jgi:beta-N-acetylhexosaminidase